jgi:hypothetical protein
MLKGIYVGDRDDLRGEHALLQRTFGGTGYIAQFNNANLVESFG